MVLYQIGEVTVIKKKYIIFESSNIGYLVFVPRSDFFKLNDKIKLFIYQYQNDYNQSLYGFLSFKERYLFADLISLSGVGPKTAISVLSLGFDYIIKLINNGDVTRLAQIPYLSPRIAKQIIFELQEKYSQSNNDPKLNQNNQPKLADLNTALKTLGFQRNQIQIALKNLTNISEPLEDLVQQSISLISNAK